VVEPRQEAEGFDEEWDCEEDGGGQFYGGGEDRAGRGVEVVTGLGVQWLMLSGWMGFVVNKVLPVYISKGP